jgi:hypothetical protein
MLVLPAPFNALVDRFIAEPPGERVAGGTGARAQPQAAGVGSGRRGVEGVGTVAAGSSGGADASREGIPARMVRRVGNQIPPEKAWRAPHRAPWG